ncbi:MAG TPA: PSD1 and planctomycete cytochrome C domain-containing protein, partial [Vicinamibacterales bacterium]|nr:PSD1 and planctomycete cytochrome C domain-containing protein [Vicinamibacterales bacterium]
MQRRFTSIALALIVANLTAALLRGQASPGGQVSSAGQAPSTGQASSNGEPPASPVSFSKDVEPILESSCRSCHGETMQMGKLDLRTSESALQGGTRGSDLVPGNAEGSRLYRRIAGLEQPAMPAQGAPLTAGQISIVRQWIDEGAVWDAATPSSSTKMSAAALAALENRPITLQERGYWAFKPPVQAALPGVGNASLANPIDRFLEQARQSHALRAAPRADRRTLVRRAYLDLVGLPPSPEQVEAFVNDRSPNAWAQLVDGLLASPHYGERYGRLWLDVARYADSAGFEYDMHRPNAWRYRDYVIKSFNDDKPYDRFIIEQLAGDEMDGKTDDSLIATGFLRMGPRVLFREKDNPERRYDYLDEIIGTIGKGMLGLTVNCARCHNHKFDPISQKDYYSIEASLFGYVETDVPLAPKAEAEAYLAKIEEINAKIANLRHGIEDIERPYRDKLQLEQIKRKFPDDIARVIAKPESSRTPGEALLATQVLKAASVSGAQLDRVLTTDDAARKHELAAQIATLADQRPKPLPMAEIATDGDYRSSPLGEGDDTVSCPKCRIPVPGAGPYLPKGPGRYEVPPSYFLIRGDAENHGSLMKPGFIDVITSGNPPTEIPRPDGRTSGRRLALAQWIASPQNPMTARVIVNRLWQKHFGRGVVATVENFGKMGEPPTHQDLLDWMAVDLTRDWSLKRITRLMMMSEAYQMASAFNDATDQANDPENRYLWRFRPQRLDAEIVRDNMLAVGGNINLEVGGEPIFPNLAKDILASQYRGKWANTPEGPAAWRRGVYVYQRRSLPYPMFDTFDHPDMNVTAGARNVSTVPTQALTLLNNPFVVSEAGFFARRIRDRASDAKSQVDL